MRLVSCNAYAFAELNKDAEVKTAMSCCSYAMDEGIGTPGIIGGIKGVRNIFDNFWLFIFQSEDEYSVSVKYIRKHFLLSNVHCLVK